MNHLLEKSIEVVYRDRYGRNTQIFNKKFINY